MVRPVVVEHGPLDQAGELSKVGQSDRPDDAERSVVGVEYAAREKLVEVSFNRTCPFLEVP
jgi:hypothetical protein